MKVIEGDITDIVKGVIVHQVNCQNVIGAGVSGALIRKYREVKTSYHDVFRNENPFYLFGKFREVAVTEDLLVVHAFSQFGYGNAGRTGKVYTDMEKLVKILSDVCKKYPDRNIYIPCGIGCGLAGGNWEELVRQINDLPLTVVELPEK